MGKLFKLFPYLSKYKIAAGAALLMMLLELAVELMQPYLISKIIDLGIQQHNLQIVWLWGGVLLLSTAIAFAAGIASSFFAAHASQGFGFDLRDTLYEKVQRLSYAAFSRFAASSLITRLTADVNQVQDLVFMALRFMTRVPLVVVGSIIMALVVNLKLGLLLALTVPLLFGFAVWMTRRAVALFRQVQQRLDGVNSVIQENLTGIRLVRVFVRMGHELERFSRASGKLMQDTIGALRLTEATLPFILLLMNAGIIAVLWFGQQDIATGEATVGEVVAVINYSLRSVGALSALSWLVASFSRASASGRRIIEVLETPEEAMTKGKPENKKRNERGAGTARAQDRLAGDIEYEGVGFLYPDSSFAALGGVSFRVRAGQRVAILGATGSGKSSLVQLLPRLYEPTEGSVRIDGVDIRHLAEAQLRASIGYVPQEMLLFSGTVRDNIAWGREEATMEEVRAAARQAQIADTIESLPHGYETLLGQRGINLSGGQKQRLMIARALVRKPAILILDDSTSALDVRTESALLEALKELSCTTIMVTQKISSAATADLILLLDGGRLIAQGRHEELLAASALYRSIYQSQYGEEARHA